MILLGLIVILIVGGLAAWVAGRRSPQAARWVSLVCLALAAVLVAMLWARPLPPAPQPGQPPAWVDELQWPWVPQLGISLHLGVDGLSLLLIALTVLLGILAVGASWTEITDRVGAFHFQLLWILAGIIGVFAALDLFLFYFFWEMMLIPMYFLISIWGHERRVYAAIKFFLFTQVSGLLMLVAILGLYFVHHRAAGVYTFDYGQLLGTPMSQGVARWLMLGFLMAFLVKLPAVPFHTWLPDAHTEAPTAGSVILAGLLLKTGAYGLLRFVVGLFPQAAADFAPIAMVLAVAGILYGAVLAFAQRDLKRLVAYTSVSHMGFVLLGVFALNPLAWQGAILEMLAHGLSTGALFIVVGFLAQRIHTRDVEQMGGLWPAMPRLGGLTLVLALASLGLPGLANFVAEFLVLLGTWRAHPWAAAVAAVGLVAAVVYALAIVQRVFHGQPRRAWAVSDLGAREVAVVGVTIAALLWAGLYPQPLLDRAAPAVDRLYRFVQPRMVEDRVTEPDGPATAAQTAGEADAHHGGAP